MPTSVFVDNQTPIPLWIVHAASGDRRRPDPEHWKPDASWIDAGERRRVLGVNRDQGIKNRRRYDLYVDLYPEGAVAGDELPEYLRIALKIVGRLVNSSLEQGVAQTPGAGGPTGRPPAVEQWFGDRRWHRARLHGRGGLYQVRYRAFSTGFDDDVEFRVEHLGPPEDGDRRQLDEISRRSAQIPRYFDFQRVDEGSRQILVGLEVDLTANKVAPDRDLYVLCDTLRVRGPIALPGKTIGIWARRIESRSGVLDVSAAAPATSYPPGPGDVRRHGSHGQGPGERGDPGQAGRPGSDGRTGGSITAIADLLLGNLELRADGGAGGRGEDGGVGGHGQKGKNGKDGRRRGALGWEWAERGHAGGDGGRGGDAGPSGTGGDGGTLQATLAMSGPGLRFSAAAGLPGEAAMAGDGGQGGEGGTGGWQPEVRTRGAREAAHRKPPGSPGKAGRAGDPAPPAAPGSPGTAGWRVARRQELVERWLEAESDELLRESLLEALTLTWHRARLAYLMDDFSAAGSLLGWLTTILVEPGSRGTSALPEASSLLAQAQALRDRLARGLDAYGYPEGYAPILSLKAYQDLARDLLALGAQIESSLETFVDREESERSASRLLQENRSRLDEAERKLESRVRDLKGDGERLAVEIEALRLELLRQRELLEQVHEQFRRDLERHLQVGLLDFLSLVSDLVLAHKAFVQRVAALGSLVDSPSAGPAGGAVRLLEVVDGGAKAVEAWRRVVAPLNRRQPDAGKLVLERDRFERWIAPFLDEVPSARGYRELMHAYFDLSDARNGRLLAYTQLLEERRVEEGRSQQLAADRRRLDARLARQASLAVSQARTLLAGLVEDLRASILDALHHEHLALRYWSLTGPELEIVGDSLAQLASLHAGLLDRVRRAQERRRGIRQQFSGKGKRIELTGSTHPLELAGLRRDRRLTLSVPAESELFAANAEAVAKAFKVRIHGARTSTGRLRVRLQHHGDARFRDSAGAVHRFQHEARIADYAYDLAEASGESGAAWDRDDARLEGGVLHEDPFIGLSPLATWTLEIRQRDNPGLDLADVEALWLQFSGTYRTRAARRVLAPGRRAGGGR